MPTFILGAGFNADAAGEVESGQIKGPRPRGYPLVGETARLCFDLDRIPADKCIEDLFSETTDYGPLARLADRLRHADHYIARELALDKRMNSYRRFFDVFSDSNFLTFNYDSLPETFLLRLGRWYPNDGYGVRVVAHLLPDSAELAAKNSSTLVLHLHGSLCIRTSNYEALPKPGQDMEWLAERQEPLYSFDPFSISSNFPPFDREVGSDDVEDRIIAPVRDKSQGLREAFIRDTYSRALAVLRSTDIAVAIGYSFNHYDRRSYEPLLDALRESKSRTLLVVTPDAGKVADAIRLCFPDLSVEPMEATFKQWVRASFPGVA